MRRVWWARFSRVRVVALCASLLTMLTPALVGCGAACTVAFAAPPQAALTVANGVVYGLGDKRFAMRASDGKMLWQNAENPYYGPHGLEPGVRPTFVPVAPVVDDQVVIETMGVGLFMALLASDGKILWHSPPLTGLAASAYGALSHPPVVADGAIYSAVAYGAIAAWDERDGHTLWVSQFAPAAETAQAANPLYSAGMPLPVATRSAIYASAGRSVYALRVSDGSVLWRLPNAPEGTAYSAPVVAANTVFMADADGTVYAIDPETGAIRWRSAGRSNVREDLRSHVVVRGQTVYVASQGSLVRALNIKTGVQLWRYQTHNEDEIVGGPIGPLAVEGGRVYLGSLSFGLYVLDAATGRELWRAPLDQDIFNATVSMPSHSNPDLSTPMIDQGTVVIVAANGLRAWRADGGQALWLMRIPDEQDPALADSAAVAAGIVYVAQGGASGSCGEISKPPRVLALRETDGSKLWQIST